MKSSLLTLWVFLAVIAGFSQNIQQEEVTFEYIQLPSEPVDSAIKNYQGHVIVLADERVKNQLEASANQQANKAKTLELALTSWEKQCEQVREQYKQELEFWNSKSFIWRKMNPEEKPSLNLPPRPGSGVAINGYQGPLYDCELLRDTYVNLEGYTNSAEHALTYTLTIHDWFNSHKLISDSYETEVKNRKVTRYKYHYQMKAKLPIALKVETPEGKILYNKIVPVTGKMGSWVSDKYDKLSYLNSSFNLEGAIEDIRQKLIKNNLKAANDFCNDLFGFPVRKHSVTLYTVNSRKADYADLDKAAKAFKQAGVNLLDDGDISGFEAASQIWEAAIQQHESNPKKGRFKKKKLWSGIMFNLVESQLWSGEFEQASLTLKKVKQANPSKAILPNIEEYERLIASMKQRAMANPHYEVIAEQKR